jgi:D-glycero-beta-D-manno-heptose-7-phosphate kinase
VWGRVSRISPEAPVPVVEVIRESYYPGGAANVARNVREFAHTIQVMGVVGQDSHAERLKKILDDCGIGLEAIESDPSFHTIVKTRIIARHQQVVRVDRERTQPSSEALQDRCLRKLHALLPELDAIIFEDYGKGFLQQRFVDEVIALADKNGKLVTADPNPRNRLTWRGLTAVKPNRSEAFAATNEPWVEPEGDPLQDSALHRVGNELMKVWSPKHLLITLGEHGMLLLDGEKPPYHVPSRAREVFDLSGAGDTAIALFTLALAGGATAIEAAEISNHASSVVVGKLGTATVSPEELLGSFRENG